MDTVKVEMTKEEFAHYQEALVLKQRQEQAQKDKEDREAYRQLSQSAVDEVFPRLVEASQRLKELKAEVYAAFQSVLDTKKGVGGFTKVDQRSHSFLSTDGRHRIRLGYYQRDGWDDTVEEGVQLVKDYLASLAGEDPKAQELVEIVLDLLSRDGKGNLRADKVLQLDKYAERQDNETFSRGVEIIKEAYRPERTKDFLTAEVKNALGKWVAVPLGMTEA